MNLQIALEELLKEVKQYDAAYKAMSNHYQVLIQANRDLIQQNNELQRDVNELRKHQEIEIAHKSVEAIADALETPVVNKQPSLPQDSLVLTLDHACRLLGIAKSTAVKAIANSGEILPGVPVIKVGSTVRVPTLKLKMALGMPI